MIREVVLNKVLCEQRPGRKLRKGVKVLVEEHSKQTPRLGG